MNDLKNSSNGLLVLKLSKPTTANVIDELREVLTPIADKLGVEPLVLPPGLDVELKMGSEALLLRVCEALEKIAAQGEAPDAHVADTAPQGLNARPSSLNSREPIGQAWPGEDSPLPPGSIFPLTPDMRVYDGRDQSAEALRARREAMLNPIVKAKVDLT